MVVAVSRRSVLRGSLASGAGLALGGAGAALTGSGAAWADTGPDGPGDADHALHLLRRGNRRWRDSRPSHPNQDAARRAELVAGQEPFVTVLSCADSRVPPELVFDRGLGDLFTVRAAGQVLDESVLGSIVYAVEHLHTPLLLVLGHQSCGAVAAAVEAHETGEVPEGHVGHLVKQLLPVVEATAEEDPEDLLDASVTANARDIAHQLAEDPELRGPVSYGELRVVAARYELDGGAVTFLDD